MTDIVIATESGEVPQDAEDKAKQLPQPSGYHILEVLSTVFFVVKIGPDAYQGDRFKTGPWCKEGDFILARPNSGTRLKIHGKEFRLINDDSVEAVVQDPRGISRA